MSLLTIDDFELKGKKILLRLDINSPIEPRSKEILDDSRITGYIPALERLNSSKVIVLSHQSRPGKSDFTTLEKHTQVLSNLLRKEVRYIDDVFGTCARNEISKLQNGDVLVLENVRFCSEEISRDIIEKSPSEQAKTHLVRNLSSCVDFFVNDAFAVSHRSQPSLVGFPMVLPSCIGPNMRKEIDTLSQVLESKDVPKVFALGGAKADDSFLITKNVLSKGIADKVLLSGVVAMIFLESAKQDIGNINRKMIGAMGFEALVPKAKELLKKFEDKIVLPSDLAFERNGKREEAKIDNLPDKKALDIGMETIETFSKEIKKAKIVVANGPAGVFEVNGFATGTEELLRSIANSKALTVIGGGHLTTVVDSIGIRNKIDHISSGGGACVSFLSDQPLPGIETIRKANGGSK